LQQKVKYPLGLLSKIWRGIKTKILKLDYLDYHPQLFSRHLSFLDGYFQSPLYYKGNEELIRKECTLRSEKISSTAKNIEIEMQNYISVSLHVRRGDLVTEIDVANALGLCSLNYYEQAIGKINAIASEVSLENPEGKSPIFYVFSDDIYWAQEHLVLPASTVYVSALQIEDYEELYLMSKCKHNIIGNSTFSWWGAWLNENPSKTVITPKQWTVKNSEHPSIIPKEWIRI
jgi:Glycosyl transferase family 11